MTASRPLVTGSLHRPGRVEPVICLLLLASPQVLPPDRPALPAGVTTSPSVAATVDGSEIFVAEVARFVERLQGQAAADDTARRRLEDQALEQLVKQQLVLSRLERLHETCSPTELELAQTQFAVELRRQEKSLEEYCQSRGIPLAAWRRALQWQLSWNRYVDKMATDENLQRYFEQHRVEFDGTRVRVAHIQRALPAAPGDRAREIEEAEVIRRELAAGTISFAEAARKYSQAPSGQRGGELGWLSRREPMPEPFAAAAFRLQVGEISPPVLGPFGVHLIQCLEIEPGHTKWDEVREPLRAAIAEHLFEWHASRARAASVIRYTRAVPPAEDASATPLDVDDQAAEAPPAEK